MTVTNDDVDFMIGTNEERPELVGEYQIRYQVSYTRYPDNALLIDTPF